MSRPQRGSISWQGGLARGRTSRRPTLRAKAMRLDLVASNLESVRSRLSGLGSVQVLVIEINDLAAALADEVVVMVEIGVEAAGLVQQVDLSNQTDLNKGVDVLVDRGVRDGRDLCSNPLHDRLRARMVHALAQDLVDHEALVRRSQTGRCAAATEVGQILGCRFVRHGSIDTDVDQLLNNNYYPLVSPVHMSSSVGENDGDLRLAWRVLRGFWRLAKRAGLKFAADDCPSLAAAIAYYAVFSLPAVLVLIVQLVGFWLGDQRVQDRVVGLLSARIGPQAAEVLRSLAVTEGEAWLEFDVAAIVAAVALLFSATTVFSQVQAALNRVWGAQAGSQQAVLKSFAVSRIFSFVMILGAGAILFLSMTARAALSAITQLMGGGFLTSTGAQVIELALSLTLTAALFAGIFRLVPEAAVHWKDACVGGAFTAVLFTLGNRVVGIYFHFVPVGGVYGSAGSLALILLWFYFAAALLLLGAELTLVYAQWRGRMIRAGAKTSNGGSGPAGPDL